MAINPLIPLAGKGLDVGRTFNNALLNVKGIQNIQQANKQNPLRNQLLQAQVSQAQSQVPTGQQTFDEEQARILNSAGSFAKANMGLVSTNPQMAMENLGKRFAELESAGLDSSHTRRGLELIQQSPEAYEAELQRISDAQDQMNKFDPNQQKLSIEREKLDIRDQELQQESAIKRDQLGLKERELKQKDRALSQKDRMLTQEDMKILFKPDVDPEKKFEIEQKLRKEVNGVTKQFRDVNDSYGRVQASAIDPSPAGDLALIFNYMKMLDPGSVVRESEFATAENTANVPERVRGFYNKILRGEKLTEKQRNDFLGRSNKLYTQASKNYQSRAGQYRNLAERSGIDPQNVILDQQLFNRPQNTPAGQGAGSIQSLVDKYAD